MELIYKRVFSGGETGMKEAGDIFREVAQAAGDIVFRYDLKTKKFMQYSDKSELSKYGSWLQDFDFAMVNANMIYREDIDDFFKLTAEIKSGAAGTIEGIFRMRLHVSSDYRWYRLVARTKCDSTGAVEVLGRVTDIHNYMIKAEEKRHTYEIMGHKIDVRGFSEPAHIKNDIVRFVKKHRADTMLACILVDILEYDNIVCVLSRAKSEELLISLLRRIKSCFPHGTFVCKVGVHRFALFSGGFAGANELLESVTGSMKEIAALGRQYEQQLLGRPLDVYAGIDFESNHDGIENVIYERATAALENMQREKTGKISFYKKPDEDVTGYEAASSEQEDMIAEYIIELLEDEEPDEIPDKDEVKAHVKACIHILLEKVAIRYGFDRVSMSICTDGGYERYAQWSGAQLSDIPEGCLLNIEGNQKMIESKINFWEPYIVNDVYSYPDSSEYGRMVGLSSVRSFAQAGFECTDGVRVIVSFEFYRKPHVWNADEINAFNTVKQVADFCARYIEEH